MPFTTPDLEFDYAALEPAIDEQTMRIHHDKHHTGYTKKLNAAVEGTDYADWPIEKILRGLDSLPDSMKTAVRNNGGGHHNHALFWRVLLPGGAKKPSGDLAAAINRDLGGYDSFVDTFSKAATTRFGSGWAWLVKKPDGKVAVYSTANQDNPLSAGDVPILGIDVWEHAYYLKYQNRRADYIASFFDLINWDRVAEYYSA